MPPRHDDVAAFLVFVTLCLAGDALGRPHRAAPMWGAFHSLTEARGECEGAAPVNLRALAVSGAFFVGILVSKGFD